MKKPDIVFPKELRGKFTDSDKKQMKTYLIGMLIGIVIMGAALCNYYTGTDAGSFNETEVYNKSEKAVLTDSAATGNFDDQDEENDYYDDGDWDEEDETSFGSEYEVVILDCTWEEAQVDAENRGGHLVVITSEEEQKEIETLIEQNGNLHTIWLGGRMEGDKIKWINGEESSYTKWGPNEPNNETGDEKYLDMYEKDGLWLWNDAPNDIKKYYSGRMGYVIEKEIER